MFCVCMCARVSMHACVCVRACVRACVRVCMCVYVRDGSHSASCLFHQFRNALSGRQRTFNDSATTFLYLPDAVCC